jgi:hypothetical protein
MITNATTTPVVAASTAAHRPLIDRNLSPVRPSRHLVERTTDPSLELVVRDPRGLRP